MFGCWVFFVVGGFKLVKGEIFRMFTSWFLQLRQVSHSPVGGCALTRLDFSIYTQPNVSYLYFLNDCTRFYEKTEQVTRSELKRVCVNSLTYLS